MTAAASLRPIGRLSYLTHNGRAVLRARWHLRGATVGSRVRLRGRPRVHNAGTLIVGERVQLVSTVATLDLETGPEGILRIGPRTLINYGTSIAAMACGYSERM